jgi:DNA-binding NarL/FixJ family response regulator
MRKTIFFYAATTALLVFLLKVLEYKYVIRDVTIEMYLGLVALLFTGLGIWVGLKFTKRKVEVVVQNSPFSINEDNLKQLGISKREYDVLELIAKGLSNQEIADRLFVSPNTIKTHTSNLFLKLDVKRRTQVVDKAKSLQLIP